MDIMNFTLSYYKNALEDFHIQRIEKPREAKKLHQHEYYQIYYIEKGTLSHYVDNTCTGMVAGDMFIIPPHVSHRIEEGETIAFYSISFMENSITDPFLKGFLSSIDVRPRLSLSSDEVLVCEDIIKHIYREFEGKRVGARETIIAYLTVLLIRFARLWLESSSTLLPITQDSRQFILHCVEYVERNFAQNITLDEVVRLSAMSRSAFCKAFRSATGYSFSRYLNLCRIRKAVSYIKEGYKITAIYGLCGYNDFSTFYRNFKRVTGVSPEEYKRG